MAEVKDGLYIGLPEFNIIDKKTTKSNDLVYTLVPKEKPAECPFCGSHHINIHKSAERKVRDLNIMTQRVGLIIKGKRYRCIDCGETFGVEYKDVPAGKMTFRLKEQVQKEAFNHTFNEVAQLYDLSVPAVSDAFNELADKFDKEYVIETPEVLGIDEVHLKKDYCGVFVDILGQKVIQMTEKRSKKVVKAFLETLDKKTVQCVTMDMWGPYRDAVNDVFPGVPVIVDHFHVIKELQKQFDSIRIGITKSLMDKKERTSLRGNRFLMLADAEDLTKTQNDRLNKLFKDFPELETPYMLKESFRMIYDSESRKEAEDTFEEWKEAVRSQDREYPEFESVIATVENWRTEIFNYFDNKYTNAETESLNNTIREIDRAGRGYTFDVLRKKVLFRHNFPDTDHFSFDTDDETEDDDL